MAHKPKESKGEHARAGRKGGKADTHKEHVMAGKDAHRGGKHHAGAKPGHGGEHQMAEAAIHIHHHHHHHHGGAKK